MNILFYDWCLARARHRLCDPKYMGVVTKRQLETGVDFQTALEQEAKAVVRRIVEAQAGKYGRKAQEHATRMEQVWRENRTIG
jgi:hypothetical protein